MFIEFSHIHYFIFIYQFKTNILGFHTNFSFSYSEIWTLYLIYWVIMHVELKLAKNSNNIISKITASSNSSDLYIGKICHADLMLGLNDWKFQVVVFSLMNWRKEYVTWMIVFIRNRYEHNSFQQSQNPTNWQNATPIIEVHYASFILQITNF